MCRSKKADAQNQERRGLKLSIPDQMLVDYQLL